MDTSILAAIIGAIATIIAALIGRDFLKSKRGRKEKTLVKQFRRYIESLQEISSEDYRKQKYEALRDDIKFNGVIDKAEKIKILNWLKSIDDEILLVSKSLARMRSTSRGLRGVTRSSLVDCSHPLGKGRSIEDLSAALNKFGILAPSTEIPPPGTHEALNAEVNPSFDFGKMLFVLRPYVEHWAVE